jgi:hypothetical protein
MKNILLSLLALIIVITQNLLIFLIPPSLHVSPSSAKTCLFHRFILRLVVSQGGLHFADYSIHQFELKV